MTTPEDPADFADLCGSLPDHATEIVTAHQGRPTVAEQDRRHGRGLPAPDHGPADRTKYGGGGQ